MIPVFATEAVNALLGGPVMTSFGLRRFTAVHFLLAVGSLGISAVHLLLVHRSFPSSSGLLLQDGSLQLESVLRKDSTVVLAATTVLFTTFSFSLVHPDNWNPFSPVSTPEHIEPEVYFL